MCGYMNIKIHNRNLAIQKVKIIIIIFLWKNRFLINIIITISQLMLTAI